MTILTKQERINLSVLIDSDKNDILNVFLNKWQDRILRNPVMKDTEWEMIKTALEKDAQAVGVDQLQDQITEEISNISNE